jgi:hypothetical protein
MRFWRSSSDFGRVASLVLNSNLRRLQKNGVSKNSVDYFRAKPTRLRAGLKVDRRIRSVVGEWTTTPSVASAATSSSFCFQTAIADKARCVWTNCGADSRVSLRIRPPWLQRRNRNVSGGRHFVGRAVRDCRSQVARRQVGTCPKIRSNGTLEPQMGGTITGYLSPLEAWKSGSNRGSGRPGSTRRRS